MTWELLVIALFVRRAVADVEADLVDALGDQAAIPKSTASEAARRSGASTRRGRVARLDDVVLDYLFLDASFFRTTPPPPPSRSWLPGDHHGRQARFVGLTPVGESTDAGPTSAHHKDRGLARPLLGIPDGARGLIAAIEQVSPPRCARY